MGTDLPTPEGLEFGPQTFEKLDLTRLNSGVVPVVVIDDKSIECIGTAFNISPGGLWVTARHILEGRKGGFELLAEKPGSWMALLWIGSGVGYDVPELLGGPIHVAQVTIDPTNGSDLALLQTSPTGIQFPVFRVSARIPKAETIILGMGYAEFKVNSDISTDELRKIYIEPNFHASTGTITQVYPEGRDNFKDLDGNFTGKLPTACFETSARFDKGMSGGPVVDPTGSDMRRHLH